MTRSPLRGRRQELDRVRALCRAATTEGAGAVLVLEGPAGIGKTQLLDAARDHAERIGMTVAAGGADEIDTAVPLAPLLGALQAARPPLLPGTGLTGLAEVVDTRLLAVEQLAGALETASAQQPVLVVLDDLQWADPATLSAVRRLPGRLRASPVAWLLARRDHPDVDAVDALVAQLVDEGADRLVLAPLPPDAIVSIAGDLTGAQPDDELVALLGQAQGSPFLGVELVRSLLGDGALLVEGGTTRLTSADLPVQFRTSVRSTLRALTPHARELVRVGAVLGRTFDVADAARLLDWSVSGRLAVIDEVLRAGVVTDTGTALRFRHDLLRQAVYEDVPRSVRTSMHREIARTLTQAGRDVLAVVPHLLLGSRPGDEQAAGQLAAAAARLASVSPAQAADVISAALELVPTPGPARAGLAVRAVPLLAYAGREEEAERLAGPLLATRSGPGAVDPVEAAQLHLALGYSRYLAGDFRSALDTVREGLVLEGLPAALRAPLLATHIEVATALAPPDDDVRASAAAVERLAAEDDAVAVAQTAAALAQIALVEGRAADGLARIGRAVPLWESLPPVFRGNRVLHVMALTGTDRFSEAEAELARGLEEAERFGVVFTVPVWHQMRGHWLLRQGDLDEAQAEAETSLQLCGELDSHQSDIDAFGLLGLLAVARDDEEEATRCADRILAVVRDGVGGDWARTGAGPAGLALAAVGRVPEALDLLDRAFRGVHGLVRAFNAAAPSMTVPLARLAADLGDLERLRQVHAVARLLRERNPGVASTAAAAAHVEGLLQRRADPIAEAVALTEGVPQLRPLHAAAAHDLGRLLATAATTSVAPDADGAVTHGPPDALRGEEARAGAVEAMERAWSTYDVLGWRPELRTVQRDLRRLGRRHRGWASRPAAPTTGWAALTPAEQRVAQLAAQGHTNRAIAGTLFVSPHTVNTHLGKVFAKLGVRSRVQLARIATEP